jgi:transposase
MAKSTAKNIKRQTGVSTLEQINPQVAGIDVGSALLMVCVGSSNRTQEVREFGTFTRDLHQIVAWFKECNISSVAMEATGVYWIPLYDIFAQKNIEVVLANPYQLKSLPGRKSDVMDCEFIQKMHSYGLLRGSFRPNDDGVALRTLVRHRMSLVEQASTYTLRAQKSLTMMNIQLRQVLSETTGATGLQILRAIIRGEHHPMTLAQYRHPQCKRSAADIALSLEGNFRPELVFTLKQAIDAYDFLHKQIIECEVEIEKKLAEFPQIPDAIEKAQKSALALGTPKKEKRRKTAANPSPYCFDAADSLTKILGVNITTIPGIDNNTALKIMSEIGTDMSRWPSVRHFVSWLGLCPGNKKSGGKILSTRTKPCDNKAAHALRLAAFSLHHANNALGGYLRKMRARLGGPKAITATAHKIARMLYAMIQSKQSYQELGLDEFERQYNKRKLAFLERSAAAMGMKLSPA